MWPFKKKKQEPELLLLSEKDLDSYEEMISSVVGSFETVFHEIASPDLHIDVIVVPANEKRDYITLVTEGMAAYPMPVPEGYGKMNRAELAIRLPKDWKLDETNDEKWYWPIRVLKVLARMPYNEKGWLGLQHTADFGRPVSEETKLSAVMLDLFDEEIPPLTLESGDQLILYNILPLYKTEMDFKRQEGADALMEKMSEEILYGPIDVHRDPVV